MESGSGLGAREPRSIERGTRGARDAERRQVTVMFCDVVGSTELASFLDPEDLHGVLQAFEEACTSVVGRFDGRVAKYMGDAVMVFFGYPRAHEDDAHRALRTALGVVEAIQQLSARLQREIDVKLSVRVGIHTGLVVASQMGSDEMSEVDVVGDTPNIAQRLQALAEPDTILITDATRRLVAGYFELQDLGPRRLKGIAQQRPVYEVLHESGARGRLDVAAAVGLTPLVGREAEREQLFAAWADAVAGDCRVVLVSGEAGIGKSRLVRELAEHVAEEPSAWLTPCQCSPYRQNAAFHPIVDVLERVVLQFLPEDDAPARLRKLEGWVAQYGLPSKEAVPLLAPLFSLPLDERYEPLQLTPERQKQQVIETVVDTLLYRAAQQPLLFVVEDLHWADASSLEMLTLLIERSRGQRMLILLTARPDFVRSWSHPELTEVALTRLEPEAVARLAEDVAGGRKLPQEVREQIVAKSDGVALFAEELTKTVLETGLLRESAHGFQLAGSAPSVAVPATLEGSLMARLDKLARARDVAQVAAVLGRDFSFHLIADLARALDIVDEETLERALEQLVDAEILYEQQSAAGPLYVFKHALICDAAYQSLLKARRRFYHEQVARLLATDSSDAWDTQPEVLAHHYTEAGMNEQAIVFWQRAAQRAIKASANVEAIAYLDTAIGLLAGIGDDKLRVRYELDLQVTRGMPLIATRGYAAADVEQAYGRARALSLAVGETPQLPNVIWGLWVYYLTGGPLRSALEMAEQYSELAARHPDDSGLALETCQLKGIALFYRGDFEQALPHLSRGSELYEPARHHRHVFEHGGADTGVALMTHESLALWAVGRLDRAEARMEAALACARGLSHPFSLAFAHYYCAWLHKLRRDEDGALQAANAANSICEEFGFPFWGLSSAVIRGATRAQLGEHDKGVADACQSLAAYEATGGLLCRSALRGLLADAYLVAGYRREGLEAIDDALAALPLREERWWEPELHRLRGELLLADSPDEAERSFRLALDDARSRNAASWELRAALSLARLWRDQGQLDAARELLAAAEARIEGGSAGADRRAARALLAEL